MNFLQNSTGYCNIIFLINCVPCIFEFKNMTKGMVFFYPFFLTILMLMFKTIYQMINKKQENLYGRKNNHTSSVIIIYMYFCMQLVINILYSFFDTQLHINANRNSGQGQRECQGQKIGYSSIVIINFYLWIQFDKNIY